MSQQVTLRNFFKGRVKASTVLDYVEKKLVAQGRRSVDGSYEVCAYRGCVYRGDVLKCGIGFLIPDSQYTPIIEGSGISFQHTLLAIVPDLLTIAPSVRDRDNKIKFLTRVQQAHDQVSDDEDFVSAVKRNIATIRQHLSDYYLT